MSEDRDELIAELRAYHLGREARDIVRGARADAPRRSS
jgi:hypothetical protein